MRSSRIAAALLALAVTTPAAASVRLAEPGYLAIDGSYYLLGLPTDGSNPQPAELHPRGTDGFFLKAYVDATGCQYATPVALVSTGGLRHAEILDLLEAPRIDLQPKTDSLPSMTLASCEGIVVLLADTPAGNAVCAGAQPFPFRRGQCPGLDRADRGHVFHDAFGGR